MKPEHSSIIQHNRSGGTMKKRFVAPALRTEADLAVLTLGIIAVSPDT
jgi:hypothetical protein